MIILGIDPGTTAVGYALIEGGGREPTLLDVGLLPIRTQETEKRLIELHESLRALIGRWRPMRGAIERIFFAKNQKTATAVAEARGAILLTTALAGLTLYEYTPLEIKKVVTGDGRADKKQVEKMVRYTFPRIASARMKDDAYDAIAVALTCYFSRRELRPLASLKQERSGSGRGSDHFQNIRST